MLLLAMTTALSVIVWILGAAFSCWIAALAAGDSDAWAWGLLGPPGWIVAGLRGTHVRLEAIRDALKPPAPATPAPTEEPGV